MTGYVDGISMLASIFAVPVVLFVWEITYGRLRRFACTPALIGAAAVTGALSLLGGGIGWIAERLFVPCLQVLIFGLFAWIYRAIRGVDLEQRPFTAFVLEGKAGLAFFDMLVGGVLFAASFGVFLGFDALIAGRAT